MHDSSATKKAGVDLSVDLALTCLTVEVESKVESDLDSKEERSENLDGDTKKTSKHDKDQY